MKENESYGVTSQASFSVRKFVCVSDESGSLEVFVVVSGKTWMEVSLIDGQTLADC